MIMDLETPDDIARMLAQVTAATGDPKALEKLIGQVDKVTAKDVVAFRQEVPRQGAPRRGHAHGQGPEGRCAMTRRLAKLAVALAALGLAWAAARRRRRRTSRTSCPCRAPARRSSPSA